MQKIGTGYYYDVYKLGSTRVTKKQTSYAHKIVLLWSWYWKQPSQFIEKFVRIIADTQSSLTESTRLAQVTTLNALLGNPVFTNEFEYEQDLAVPLKEQLVSLDENEFTSLVRHAGRIVHCRDIEQMVVETVMNALIAIVSGLASGISFHSFSFSPSYATIHNFCLSA